MAAKKINVAKVKVWGERSNMETEGPTSEVVFYAFCMIPTEELRQTTINRMLDVHKELTEREAART